MRQRKVINIERFDNFSPEKNEIGVERFYNYAPKEVLSNSKGISIAKFPLEVDSVEEVSLNYSSADFNTVEGIAYFKQSFPNHGTMARRLLVYGDNKKAYIAQLMSGVNDLFWLFDLEFNSAPITLAYKKDDADAVVLASNDMMKVWRARYSPYTIKDAPIITSMCMNDGVLFCTIKDPAFKVWYATDLDAENVGKMSDCSDYISLEDDLGDARKVVTFNESVFVFRDYGITKINYIKEEIVISQIYQSNTKIYANTVSVCGNSILFMTNDGLFSFNGVKVSKTKVEFLSVLEVNDNAFASSLGEKYYLSMKLDFADGEKVLCENTEYINNALVVVDTNDFSYEILRGVDVKSLLPVKTEVFEKMLVVFGSEHKTQIGEVVEGSNYVDKALPKLWQSNSLTQDMNLKMITKLDVKCDAGVEFVIITDTGKFNFVAYNKGINKFNFKICCKDVKIAIMSKNMSGEVENVSLDYYEY